MTRSALLETPRFAILPAMPRVLPLLILCAAAHAAEVAQFRADTDGDGIDDATELAGLAAGVADLDPLVPATFMADEPDTDENGIPDLWENADVPLFYGIDADGFPWDVPVPEEAANNYGGTADFAAGAWDTVRSHVREDVNPFLHSLHLDGNPCGITTFNNITRP